SISVSLLPFLSTRYSYHRDPHSFPTRRSSDLLGRDLWSEQQFFKWFAKINTTEHLHVVLDADALWFLAEHPEVLKADSYATPHPDRKSTRLNSSHVKISYAVFCLKKKRSSVDL